LQGALAHAKNGDKVFWEEIFFHFSRLPNVFALCSFQVPNGFPIFSPTFSPYLLTFIPYALENGVLLSPIYVGQRGGTVQFKIELSVLGSLHCFFFFGVMGQSNWRVAEKKEK
jgi:hypothetical protein